jgi:hypothetical protein
VPGARHQAGTAKLLRQHTTNIGGYALLRSDGAVRMEVLYFLCAIKLIQAGAHERMGSSNAVFQASTDVFDASYEAYEKVRQGGKENEKKAMRALRKPVVSTCSFPYRVGFHLSVRWIAACASLSNLDSLEPVLTEAHLHQSVIRSRSLLEREPHPWLRHP